MIINAIMTHWRAWLDMLWLPLTIQIVAILIGYTINRFIRKKIDAHLDFEENSFQDIILSALNGVSVSFCSGIGLYWCVNTLHLPEKIQHLLSNVLVTVIFLTIAKVIANIIVGIVERKTDRSGRLETNNSIIVDIIKTIVYVLTILCLLQYYGLSITSVITALGIGAMSVALALQDILANIFCGLNIVLSKQILVGDYISLSTGEEGCVADVKLRYTTIKTNINNTIVIPNKTISAANLTNYNRPAQDVSIIVPVGVDYSSDLDKVERVTLEVAKDILNSFEGGLEDKDPKVLFHTFNEYSIDFNVVLHCRKYPDQVTIKHEFIKALAKRYREEDIDIPSPIMKIKHGDD